MAAAPAPAPTSAIPPQVIPALTKRGLELIAQDIAEDLKIRAALKLLPALVQQFGTEFEANDAVIASRAWAIAAAFVAAKPK